MYSQTVMVDCVCPVQSIKYLPLKERYMNYIKPKDYPRLVILVSLGYFIMTSSLITRSVWYIFK